MMLSITTTVIILSILLLITQSNVKKPKEKITAVKTEVVVTDIKMPFMSMVTFMVKWALASIPALIILLFIGCFFFYSTFLIIK